MDEAVLRIRVGVFVVFAFAILGLLIFLNSEGFTRQYTVYVKPQSAPGVSVGTPVRKNGILIGRVGTVKTQDDHVVLTLKINVTETVYENEICSIGADGFLGDSVVEILPLPKNQRGELVTEGNLLSRVSVKRNPMEVVELAMNLEGDITKTLEVIREAGASVNSAGQGIETLTSTVQDAFSNEDSDVKSTLTDIRLMSQKAQTALDNFNRMFENVNEIVGDPEMKAEIKDAVASLPEILNEIRITISDTRETINGYRSVSEKATRNLDNLEDFTVALQKDGPEILSQVNASLKNTDALMEKIGTFAETLSTVSKNLANSEGTIGKLLNDPKLYNSALGTVEDVRGTINDLSLQLQPLVRDLRMFADALARDPRQVGIKGAIDRRPSGSGYKGSTTGRGRTKR